MRKPQLVLVPPGEGSCVSQGLLPPPLQAFPIQYHPFLSQQEKKKHRDFPHEAALLLSQSLPCPQPAAPVPNPANKQLQHKPWPSCASVSPHPPVPSTAQGHPSPAESCVPPRPPNHRSSLSLQQEEPTQRGSPGIVPTFTISLGDMQVSAVRGTPGGQDPLGTRWGHPGTLHPPCSVPCSSPLPLHGASAGGPRWKGAARHHPRC